MTMLNDLLNNRRNNMWQALTQKMSSACQLESILSDYLLVS